MTPKPEKSDMSIEEKESVKKFVTESINDYYSRFLEMQTSKTLQSRLADDHAYLLDFSHDDKVRTITYFIRGHFSSCHFRK